MTDTLAVATLTALSGIPEDNYTNSFALKVTGAPIGTTASLIADALQTFYTSLSFYLGQSVSRAADQLIVKLYDLTGHLDGSPHGSPIFTRTRQIVGAPSGVNYPTEVAAVLTLRAFAAATPPPAEAPDGSDPGIALDRPRQRKSGRVYIGPLTSQAGIIDAAFSPRPTLNFRTDVLDYTNTLRDTLAASTIDLGVWSRVDGQVNAAVHASIDDAFDTQRRRGPTATVRQTITL